MKHIDVIRPFLDAIHESWMSDTDKAEFDALVVERYGAELDLAIEQGISNGYSPQQQAELMNKVFG